MIAFRDDLQIRAGCRRRLAPDRWPGQEAARRYLRDRQREGTPGWLWALAAALVALGAVLA